MSEVGQKRGRKDSLHAGQVKDNFESLKEVNAVWRRDVQVMRRNEKFTHHGREGGRAR